MGGLWKLENRICPVWWRGRLLRPPIWSDLVNLTRMADQRLRRWRGWRRWRYRRVCWVWWSSIYRRMWYRCRRWCRCRCRCSSRFDLASMLGHLGRYWNRQSRRRLAVCLGRPRALKGGSSSLSSVSCVRSVADSVIPFTSLYFAYLASDGLDLAVIVADLLDNVLPEARIQSVN